MTDSAPISVIIPAYDSEDFIGEAIATVQAQTLPVAEIIVVDDGSSDRTAEIAKAHGARVIRQVNRGVSAARNVGIRAATQEWIALLDQDDIWAPEKIEYQWRAIQFHPDVGIVSCDMNWFEHSDTRGCSAPTGIDGKADLVRKADADPSVKYFRRVRQELPLSRTTDNPSSVLIRRDVLMSVGLFDEGLHQNEDLECFLRVIAQYPLAVVERSLVKRRLHARNRSNDSLEASLSYVKVIEKLRSEPRNYPPDAAQAYADEPWRLLIDIGRSLLDQGRMREARALFIRSLKKTYSHRAVFLWCLTFLGRAAFKHLLTIKRKLNKKAVAQ